MRAHSGPGNWCAHVQNSALSIEKMADPLTEHTITFPLEVHHVKGEKQNQFESV